MKYQLVQTQSMAQINKASELLSKVDLKQFSFLVGVAMEGHVDVEAQIFKNGLLADSLTEVLKQIAKENLLCEFAAILFVNPEDLKEKSYEAWEEKHAEIAKDLLFENPKEVFDAVGKYLLEKFDLKTNFQSFMKMATENEELPNT